ncbi:MAG: MMPL family transporter, partial [Verrucomicrobiales bacterium]|nr:MMPL family transporter [Verrucomicrobiales bacterium]
MNPLREDTFFGRLLSGLAAAVCRHPRWFVGPQLGLFALSVFYTATELQFDTSRNNLVGADKKYHQNFLRFKREFPTQDDLVVVVESEDPEKNRQFIERLGAKIETARIRLPAPDGSGASIETNLFNHIFYKGDLKLLGSKALLFVSEPELAALRDQLRDYRPFLDEFAQTTNLVSLFEMINRQFRAARPEADAQNERLVQMIPALERIVTQATASLRRAGVPPSPGVFALFGDHDKAAQSVYLTFAGGRIWIATAQALTEELNGEAVERMRQLVAETRVEVPGLNVGLTGEPVLERDEMRQSQRDTALASVVALLLTAVIFIYGYQETGRPLKATLCLVVGVGYTLGFATLTVGHLNLLTITFVPILIGLAIDFGVHLVTRYEEELRHGRTETEALRRAMVFTGQGIFTGAFTTAGAFLAMMLTDFKGIQEMGLICGAGLLICLVPMLTLLPVLLLRGRQNVLDHQLGERLSPRARIEQLWLRRPAAVLAVTVTLCALAALQFRRVYFDYNLLNMQSEGLPSVVFEEKLINAASPNPNGGATNGGGRSVLFAAVITDSLEQALAVEERVRALPSVGEVDSIARFLTENQEQKLRLIGEIKQTLASLRFAPLDPRPVNIPDLSRTLWSLNGYVGLAREAAQKEAPEVAAQLDALHAAVERLRVELFAGRPREQAERAARLAAFQRALFADFRETFTALQQQDDRGRLRVEDLPAALRDRF